MPDSRCLLATSCDTIRFIRYHVKVINAHSIRIARNANWMRIKKHVSCEHGFTGSQSALGAKEHHSKSCILSKTRQ